MMFHHWQGMRMAHKSSTHQSEHAACTHCSSYGLGLIHRQRMGGGFVKTAALRSSSRGPDLQPRAWGLLVCMLDQLNPVGRLVQLPAARHFQCLMSAVYLQALASLVD